ncbi:FAD-dependent monooxygenase [Streptomyces sp. NPDC102283]|uniref:FAD-dependent monooxygenase n=1 Tax=Streptomyces sp. NPDC102283 TaxID=3366155 RepID=UPI003825EB9E
MTHAGTRSVHADICVVGGGPAGLTLALLLLRSGVRVTVVERSRSLDREYRGEILQPGGAALLDRLGVLAGARRRGAHEHTGFRFTDRGRVLLVADYRRLPGPYNQLLSLPQRHLLEELLEQCGQFADFRYLSGQRASELLRDGRGAVRGVRTTGAERVEVLAHCVVGADGRYSKIRRLAGIEVDRAEAFAHDVLWFRLPADGDADGDAESQVRIFRGGGNPVLAYRSFPDTLQVGWTLPHGGYRAEAARGIDHIAAEIATSLPMYADRIAARLGGLSDLTLLDVFTQEARDWTADGLVLLGDAAHTHSPIGAQGINLAVQDAVALHPVLMTALEHRDARAEVLERFTRRRRPAVRRVMRFQALQSKAMLSQNPVAARVRPRIAGVVSRTPLFRAILRHVAYGDQGIAVAEDHFVRR